MVAYKFYTTNGVCNVIQWKLFMTQSFSQAYLQDIQGPSLLLSTLSITKMTDSLLPNHPAMSTSIQMSGTVNF